MSALLALSDVAVMRALERSFSRCATGDQRRAAERDHLLRHHAYQSFPIDGHSHTQALTGAWDLLAELAWRWQLPVEAAEWGGVLDRYSRGLLASRADHDLDQLEAALRTLGAGHAA